MDGKPQPEPEPRESSKEQEEKSAGSSLGAVPQSPSRATGFCRPEPAVEPEPLPAEETAESSTAPEPKKEAKPETHSDTGDESATESGEPSQRKRPEKWLKLCGAVLSLAMLISGGVMIAHWETEGVPTDPSAGQVADAPMVEGEIVLNLVDDITDEQIAQLESEFDIQLSFNSVHSQETKLMIGRTALRGAEYDQLVERLKENKLVENAEPQFIFEAFAPTGSFPNDPHYPQQWNLKMIGMDVAWQFATGEGAVVSVIDSGVMIEQAQQSIALTDLQGTARVPGFDFFEDDTDPQDYNGHGSHVAGTIAQTTNNGEGVAGVAYEATIMPIRALGPKGRGNNSDIAEAVRWSADNGAHIINMSLGGSARSQEIEDAIEHADSKGALVICASGNDGKMVVSWPAASPKTLAVSSVGPNGNLATYSNYGGEIDLAAPGGAGIPGINPREILDFARNWLTGKPQKIIQQSVDVQISGSNGPVQVRPMYAELVGTSMACPHVAGVAALLWSMGITDPAEIRNILKKSCLQKSDTLRYGAGVIDAAAAVKMARNTVGAGMLNSGFAAVLIFVAIFAALTKGTGAVLAVARNHWSRIILLGLGLFLPSLVTWAVGVDSYINLIGHGALLPLAYLQLLKPANALLKGLRFFVIGLAIHLFIDLQMNASPFPVIDAGKLKFWLIINLLVCGYLILATRQVEANAKAAAPFAGEKAAAV